MIHVRALVLAMVRSLVVQGATNGAEPTSPMIVGHRGLSLHAPENTLPA